MCDSELANAFLCDVMEAPLEATDDLLATLPASTRPQVLKMLKKFARRDYFDDRHAYINDGRTLEERRQHKERMQPHCREVGERLLLKLQSEV